MLNNIYPSYTNHYYNNNHYTMGIFSCLCVVCPDGVCFRLKQELVKTFTDRQKLASWQVLGAVSEAEWCWGMFWPENNALVLDCEHLFVVQYRQ